MVILILLLLFLHSPLYSQNVWLPNSGFEDWKLVGISEEPVSWGTMNQASFTGSVVNAFKDTNSYEGNYSLRLESKLHINPVDSTSKIYTGMAGLNAVFSENNMGYVDFNVKPLKLNGYYKSTVNPGDSCIIVGFLQKFSSDKNKYENVGIFFESFTSNINTWTSFESFVYYYGLERPERLTMLLIAGDIDNPTAGNILCIDKLSFTYYASAVDDNIDLWPNTDMSIPVLDNDEGINLSINSTSTATNGTCQIVSNEILYSPDIDFKGIDQFNYVICDMLGECDTGNVTINVNYGLSINGKSNNSMIEVYPNPAKDKFKLNIARKYLSSKIYIYSYSGKLVLNKELDHLENEINIQSLNKGIYYLYLINNNKVIYNNIITLN